LGEGKLDSATTSELAVARYGTDEAPPVPRRLQVGGLSLSLDAGAVRHVALNGIEVVRGIDYPVRDADWATLPSADLVDDLQETADGATWRRDFSVADAFTGRLSMAARGDAGGARLDLDLRLEASRDVSVNRAGFVVLHPLRDVFGEGLRVRHPDGSTSAAAFPARISPGQPVFDIAGLSHRVGPVSVEIDFAGDVFEMEDQRNWTDASYKTYCRPLERPRPFALAAGEAITQRIVVRMSGPARTAASAAETPAVRAPLPQLGLALDEAIAPLSPEAWEAVRQIPFAEVQVRLRPGERAPLAAARRTGLPVALEVVLPERADPDDGLERIVADCRTLGVVPARVMALPEPYLSSIQPQGPWPNGPGPHDAARAARTAFPRAGIGGGVLTNFTEFNRCPPDFPSDYVSFGTTAIVHAADDVSVLETLEALPHVFATARAHAGDRPLRLGLVTIGMRSNPYGAALVDNPRRERLAMAMADPRQRGLFAAAFAVGAVAAAAAGGVLSLAPGMASGPLGLTDDACAATPLYHVVRALGHLSGAEVEIAGHNPGGLVAIRAAGRDGLRGVVANLGEAAADLRLEGERAALLNPATVRVARARDWLDDAPRSGGRATLEPLDVAILFGGAA
jgi:hypothetical protein